MTTTTHGFSRGETSARQPMSHGFRSDAAFGLAAILVVAMFALAGILGGARTQTGPAGQPSEASPMSGGFENVVPPERFPLSGYDFATTY